MKVESRVCNWINLELCQFHFQTFQLSFYIFFLKWTSIFSKWNNFSHTGYCFLFFGLIHNNSLILQLKVILSKLTSENYFWRLQKVWKMTSQQLKTSKSTQFVPICQLCLNKSQKMSQNNSSWFNLWFSTAITNTVHFRTEADI